MQDKTADQPRIMGHPVNIDPLKYGQEFLYIYIFSFSFDHASCKLMSEMELIIIR